MHHALPALDGTAAHILVAEDDPPSAAVLRAVLVRAGYEVSVVEDGASALAHLERHGAPDVLLLDWMLPGISGIEVCDRARQRWDALELPILMVTARDDAESISAAFDAGASDYLTKPFLGAELRSRIAAQLRIRRMVEERRRMEDHLREREKLSALGLLVSSVAHDLSNPLTAISGYAQMLLHDEADARRAEDLRQILGGVDRCRKITSDLLAFARREPAERGEVDVGAVVRATFELRERHLLASGVRASLVAEEALPPVTGVAHQLQQVFLNILLNAEHALAAGDADGGELRMMVGPRPAREGWIAIDFYNSGPPIPDELLPRIFDPFFTTKSVDEGTGLGLAVCRRIVREHGGEIEVESGGEGTTFRVVLPGK
jgi:signal transduction histidine kinase